MVTTGLRIGALCTCLLAVCFWIVFVPQVMARCYKFCSNNSTFGFFAKNETKFFGFPDCSGSRFSPHGRAAISVCASPSLRPDCVHWVCTLSMFSWVSHQSLCSGSLPWCTLDLVPNNILICVGFWWCLSNWWCTCVGRMVESVCESRGWLISVSLGTSWRRGLFVGFSSWCFRAL